MVLKVPGDSIQKVKREFPKIIDSNVGRDGFVGLAIQNAELKEQNKALEDQLNQLQEQFRIVREKLEERKERERLIEKKNGKIKNAYQRENRLRWKSMIR